MNGDRFLLKKNIDDFQTLNKNMQTHTNINTHAHTQTLW